MRLKRKRLGFIPKLKRGSKPEKTKALTKDPKEQWERSTRGELASGRFLASGNAQALTVAEKSFLQDVDWAVVEVEGHCDGKI